jgi:sporulation protein YlmC with PRC-barrel domain
VKKTASVLTATFLGLALVVTASAQTRPSTDPSAPKDTMRTAPTRSSWAPGAGAVESSKLIGMKVKNTAGKDVGEIAQLIVNPADGKITHAVLGKGGVLGVGEQRVALAWTDVKVQPDTENRNRWIAVVDQAKLDGAPKYETRRDTMPAASPATAPTTDKKN